MHHRDHCCRDMRSSARIQRRGRDSDKLTGGSERGVHTSHNVISDMNLTRNAAERQRFPYLVSKITFWSVLRSCPAHSVATQAQADVLKIPSLTEDVLQALHGYRLSASYARGMGRCDGVTWPLMPYVHGRSHWRIGGGCIVFKRMYKRTL